MSIPDKKILNNIVVGKDSIIVLGKMSDFCNRIIEVYRQMLESKEAVSKRVSIFPHIYPIKCHFSFKKRALRDIGSA